MTNAGRNLDALWDSLTPATKNGAKGRAKCRRHEWERTVAGMPWPARCRVCRFVTEDPDAYFFPADFDAEMIPEDARCLGTTDGAHQPETRVRCSRCSAVRDAAVSRRSKNNRSRGLAIQREIARSLGLVNLQGNGPTDARSESEVFGNAAFVCQVKSGARFPGWMATELAKLPTTGGRIPILAIAETPGPGRKRRAVIVVEIGDWISLHVGDPK